MPPDGRTDGGGFWINDCWTVLFTLVATIVCTHVGGGDVVASTYASITGLDAAKGGIADAGVFTLPDMIGIFFDHSGRCSDFACQMTVARE